MLSNVCGDAIALLVYYLLNRFFPAREAQVAVAVHDVKDYGSGSELDDEGSMRGRGGRDGSGAFGMGAAGGVEEKEGAEAGVRGVAEVGRDRKD